MSEKFVNKPLFLVLVIAIPLLIASIGAFFAFRSVLKNMQTSLKNNQHVSTDAFANGFKDQQKFEEIMIDFYSMANMAQDIFPVDTASVGREKALSDIKDIGIYYWNRNLEIIDSLDKLAHSKNIQPKITTYRTYSTLNKEYYMLIYKAVDERSSKYDAKIKDYETQINKISKEIYSK